MNTVVRIEDAISLGMLPPAAAVAASGTRHTAAK